MRALLRSVTAALLTAAALGWPSPAHADFDLRVIWPTASMVGPSSPAYRMVVSDTGPGDLYAVWRGDRLPLPHNGAFDMTFPTDGSDRVTVERCRAGVCSWAGVASPQLDVYRAVGVGVQQRPTASPSVSDVDVYFSPVRAGVEVSAQWELLSSTAPDAEILATGSTTVVPTSSAPPIVVPMSLPAGIADGAYGLRMTLSEDIGAGVITGSSSLLAWTMDSTPPPVTLQSGKPTVFPVTDGYRDTVSVKVTAPDAQTFDWRVTSPGGTVLADLGRTYIWQSPTKAWNGTLGAALAPEGPYRIEVVATDAAGNSSTQAIDVSVSHSRLEFREWTSTVTPKASLVAKEVGACAQVSSPARPGWTGSTAYLTGTTCRKAADRRASTTHELVVPDSYRGRYRGFTMDVYGGGRAHALKGQLGLSYRIGYGRRLGKDLGWHEGAWVAQADKIVRVSAQGPEASWTVSASDGSEYDVKTFRVRVSYQVLVDTSGNATVPTD